MELLLIIAALLGCVLSVLAIVKGLAAIVRLVGCQPNTRNAVLSRAVVPGDSSCRGDLTRQEMNEGQETLGGLDRLYLIDRDPWARIEAREELRAQGWGRTIEIYVSPSALPENAAGYCQRAGWRRDEISLGLRKLVPSGYWTEGAVEEILYVLFHELGHSAGWEEYPVRSFEGELFAEAVAHFVVGSELPSSYDEIKWRWGEDYFSKPTPEFDYDEVVERARAVVDEYKDDMAENLSWARNVMVPRIKDALERAWSIALANIEESKREARWEHLTRPRRVTKGYGKWLDFEEESWDL